MGDLAPSHLLLLLVIVLIFFGPSRLPGLGKSVGQAIKGFKDGLKEGTSYNPNQPTTTTTTTQQVAGQTQQSLGQTTVVREVKAEMVTKQTTTEV